MANLWMVAAKICSAQGFIAASMAKLAFLTALLTVDPLQTLPGDSLLYQIPSDPLDLSRPDSGCKDFLAPVLNESGAVL